MKYMLLNLLGDDPRIVAEYPLKDIKFMQFLTKRQMREQKMLYGSDLEEYKESDMFIRITFNTKDAFGDFETATLLARNYEVTYR